MRPRNAFWVLGLAVGASVAACIRTSDGILSIELDAFDNRPVVPTSFPLETTSDTVNVQGIVVRLPPRQMTRTRVVVEGGSFRVETEAGGANRFQVDVPLRVGTINTLTFRAEDDTGAVSTPLSVDVTHIVLR